jgi:hypothetical protein
MVSGSMLVDGSHLQMESLFNFHCDEWSLKWILKVLDELVQLYSWCIIGTIFGKLLLQGILSTPTHVFMTCVQVNHFYN